MKSKKQTKINRFEWVRFIMSFKSLLKHCDCDKLVDIYHLVVKEMGKRGKKNVYEGK